MEPHLERDEAMSAKPTLEDSDIQILCAIQNAKSAAAQMLAANNYSMATHGVPGNDPGFIFGQEFYALAKEAESRGLIKPENEVKE